MKKLICRIACRLVGHDWVLQPMTYEGVWSKCLRCGKWLGMINPWGGGLINWVKRQFQYKIRGPRAGRR